MKETKHSDFKNTLKLREEPELWRIIGSSNEIKDVLSKIQTVWTVMYLSLYKVKPVRERSWLQKLSTIEGQEARSPYAL